MITPRTTRLIRARDLRAFRLAVRQTALGGGVASTRRRAVIVPTRTAAEQLRRSLEETALQAAIVVPHLLTRDDWRAMLSDSLADHPRQLSAHEREVLLGASAREAVADGVIPPFSVRPGLLALVLQFYDALRRQLRSVDDFERLMSARYEPEVDHDRGAIRMLAQTRFLASAFRGYERRLETLGAFDEHRLRSRLIDDPVIAADSGLTHVIVAVGDRAGDSHGLWLSDFDLLARQSGVTQIEIVATERTLAAGFLERIRELLPGIEETDARAMEEGSPVIVAPPGEDGPLYATHRDREEELRAVARRIKQAHRSPNPSPLSRTGIVFRRPLPYVYLAGQVLPSAGVPHQAFDALPLASEPYAAALDLVFDCVDTGFAREPLVLLLRTPAFTFLVNGQPVPAVDVAVLDRALSDARYLGDPAELPGFVASSSAGQAACDVAQELAPLTKTDRPSAHLDLLIAFLAAHDRAPGVGETTRERWLRARGAIQSSLRGLRDAHRHHDDAPRPFDETAAAIRRWVGHQTFAPRRGSDGVQLIDTAAVRFGDFDTLYLVGLTAGEWPGSERRSIFYPASFLSDLGWPKESAARAADRAIFEDVVRGAAREVVVSTFTLEDDAIVEPSPFLEDLSQIGLAVSREEAPRTARIFGEDALIGDPICASALSGSAATWLAARAGRTESSAPAFHGQSFNPALPAYKVSSLDQYLGCPFAYFATHVLKLDEDPDDEESLGPREQGKFVHAVLERFYDAWQAEGNGAITNSNIDAARTRFAAIVEEALAKLPESDAALQRVRVLGSPVAPGFGDVVFRLEAEDPVPVIERLLEFKLSGDTIVRSGETRRAVALSAIADRIDLLQDGTFRLIDYKLSRAPDKKQVVQLPAYAATIVQRLEGRHGRSWRPGDVAYIAFGKTPHVPLARNAEDLEAALREGEERLLATVDRIERGEFPPTPQSEHRCTYCPFSSVCRKDYVGDQ